MAAGNPTLDEQRILGLVLETLDYAAQHELPFGIYVRALAFLAEYVHGKHLTPERRARFAELDDSYGAVERSLARAQELADAGNGEGLRRALKTYVAELSSLARREEALDEEALRAAALDQDTLRRYGYQADRLARLVLDG